MSNAGHVGDEPNLRLSDVASDKEDEMEVPNFMDRRPKASGDFRLTTESPFEPLRNPSPTIHRDVVINDSEDDPVMVEDNPSYVVFTSSKLFSNFNNPLSSSVVLRIYRLPTDTLSVP